MNIAISNIAWDPTEEAGAAQIMQNLQIRGVEIAPTKTWDAPQLASKESILNYGKYWSDQNVKIVAMQSLLFGRPDLQLFQDASARDRTFDYLCDLMVMAETLGARVLVFGSPKNRQRGDLTESQAFETAVEFFGRVGRFASEHNVCFCIEPNPAVYGCDFVRTAAEGRALVKAVNKSGFRLHLDAAIMTLNEENIETEIEASMDYLAHFHISEPQLGVVGEGVTDHLRFARCLKALGYSNWVSIEMRNGWKTPNTLAAQSALDYAIGIYGNRIDYGCI